MNASSRPSYHAVVLGAVEATGATSGWLLRAVDDRFVVVAACGNPEAERAIGATRESRGMAAFVLASGQPAAIQTRPGDTDNDGAGGATGAPRSLLAVPCATDEVLGVLELVDAPSGSFSFDDVEIVSLLADVAGAALGEDADFVAPATPQQLYESLRSLAALDPTRYRDVARIVGALL